MVSFGIGLIITIIISTCSLIIVYNVMPDVLSNFSSTSKWSGTSGRIVTSVLPILIVVGLLFILFKRKK